MPFLQPYIAQRNADILQLLKVPQKEWDTESFHRLRVEIKKLTAVMKFLADGNRHYKRKKTGSALKELFRLAGRVRELQLITDALPHETPTLYKEIIRQRLQKELLTYALLIDQSYLERLEKELNRTLRKSGQLTPSMLEVYLFKCRKRIRKTMKGCSQVNMPYHKLRRQLKAYLYLYHHLPGAPRATPELDRLLQHIGEWHDNEVMARLLLNDSRSNAFAEPVSAWLIQQHANLFKGNAALLERIRAQEHLLKLKKTD